MPRTVDKLARALNLTPYSRDEFLQIQEKSAGQEIQLTGDPVEDARRFCVRCHQGFGSKMADRVGWKNTKNAAGPANPKIWSKLPANVYQVAERLKNAQIESVDAVHLIKSFNHTNCLIYADPPYLGECRNGRMYRKEMMSREEHEILLDTLLDHNHPVILSGYDNDLYNQKLIGWYKEQKIGYAENATPRTETLWINFELQTRFYL